MSWYEMIGKKKIEETEEEKDEKKKKRARKVQKTVGGNSAAWKYRKAMDDTIANLDQ